MIYTLMKEKIICALEAISLGKHKHGLYHLKRSSYSTWIGGIISIFAATALLTYSVIVIVGIFNRDEILLTQESKLIE